MSQARMIVRRLAAAALLVIAALAGAAACGEYVTGNGGAERTRSVRGLSMATTRTTITQGDTIRLALTAFDQVGRAFDPMPGSVLVEWVSDNPEVATVSADGLVTAIGVGTARITARAGNITALPPVSVVITVRYRARFAVDDNEPRGTVGEPLSEPVRLRVLTPDSVGIAGAIVRFVVTDPAGDSTVTDVAADAAGDVVFAPTLGTRPGSYVIHARLLEATDVTATIVVVARAAAASRIEIVNGGAQTGTVGEALAQQLVVRVTDQYGNPVSDSNVVFNADAGSGAASPTAVRTDANGLASAQWTLGTVAGAQRVRVMLGDVATATFDATARPGPIAVVSIDSASLAFATLGRTSRLSAVLADRFGNVITGTAATWSSSIPAVASVDAAGNVRAVAEGSALIIGSAGGVADTIPVTVRQVAATVTATPSALTLKVNTTAQLSATVADSGGALIAAAVVTWRSENSSVARVDAAGLVTGVEGGTTSIIATSGSAADTVVVTVRGREVVSVVVLPQRVTLAPGQSAQFTATAYDAEGQPIDTARFAWRSSDERVATVNENGVVTGVAAGEATISATSGGVTGSASSATIVTCGPTGIAPFGVAQSLQAPECVLRLNSGTNQGSGGAWSTTKPRVINGFDVAFQFRISEPGNGGADGFAFIIQNTSGNYVGGGGGGIGYHGLPRSVAIEFDTWWNPPGEAGDPDDNHISVHTNGLNANNVDESYSIGMITAANMPFRLDDAAVHTVRVRYVPGVMEIYLDGATTPNLVVRIDLGNIDGAGNSMLDQEGRAWMGFTAATGGAYETHDILNWEVGTSP